VYRIHTTKETSHNNWVTSRLSLLWVIAFLEGFSTLAVEVIAIRLAVPVVGSSIVLTGVMLGVVLFALSAGYWRGGALSAGWTRSQTQTALARNLFIAAVLYGALAFPFEARLLEWLLSFGLSLPLAIGAMAAVLFLAPIYLASQTVPMLAELTNVDGHAGRASGKVLFFSTIGSVAGGIITPVWLFPSIGVSASTYIVCALLLSAAGVMTLGQMQKAKLAAAAIVIVVVRTATANQTDLYSFDSAYQSIRVIEDKDADGRLVRILMVGGGRASGIYADTGETSFAYSRAAVKALEETKAENALVIGAAGFNVPRDASRLPWVKQVDAVDIDPAVRPAAELHFLREPLPAKVRFIPLSARYAVRKLHGEGRQYGYTFIDAYFGQGIPEELATLEFFADVRRISSHTAANVILDRDLESTFSKNLLATFHMAFGEVWITDPKPGDSYYANILVTSWPLAGSKQWIGKGQVYRDDRNAADRDHVELMWGSD
jgi:spermidine synthase